MNNRFTIAFRLIKKNIKKIIIFEAIYKLSTLAIFTPVLVELVKVALKLSGINYLTNARFFDFLFKPTTIAILFLAMLVFALVSLMEMSALTYCYNISYNGGNASVADMIKAGAGAAIRLIGPYNAYMILFVLMLIPVTHMGAISGYITSMQIPVFIIEYIKLKKIALFVVTCMMVLLSILVIRWINVLNYYTTEKMNFKNARKASENLNRYRYFGLIMGFIIWQGLILVLLFSSYALITFVITKTLKFILKKKLAYTISLYSAKIIYQIWSAIYFCMIVPLTCAFLSGYFFARKKRVKEEIVIPVMPGEKRYSESKFKRRLSVIVLISAILNIVYINFDFGIFRGSANVQLLNKTLIAAHRGYSSEAPENTIPAFEEAISNMSDYVELDVQETKDGKIVVLHDSNLKRVAGINKNIWNLNYADIADVDVGSWFSEDFVGVTIPTLEEVMEMAKGRLKLNIEIKLTGHEKNIEKSVVKIIEKYGMENDCVVTSFQAKALKKVKEANPDIQTGYILHVAYGDFSSLDYADALSVNYSFATELLIDEAHSTGKKVYVWTVNTSEAINNMINNGADMIITDDPVLAKETILSYETNPQVVKLIKYYMK